MCLKRTEIVVQTFTIWNLGPVGGQSGERGGGGGGEPFGWWRGGVVGRGVCGGGGGWVWRGSGKNMFFGTPVPGPV
jgi:hypothetical protein